MVYRGKPRKEFHKGKGSKNESSSSRQSVVAGSVKPAIYINPAKDYVTTDPMKGPNGTPTGNVQQVKMVLSPIGDGASKGTVTAAMSEIYARMRAVNAGAVNYGPNYLYMYISWVRNFRAVFAELVKLFASTGVKLMGYDTYPSLCFNGVGGTFYDLFTADLADKRAKLLRLAQDIDALPIIPFDAYRTDVDILTTIVKENYSGRSSYICPVLSQLYVLSWNTDSENPETWTITGRTFGTSSSRWDDLLSFANNWLLDFLRNPVISILRGDILKAYGVVRCGPTCAEMLEAGIKLTDDPKYQLMYHNSTDLCLNAVASLSVVNTATTGAPEFKLRVTQDLKIPGLNDNKDVVIFDIPVWDEETLDWATRLKVADDGPLGSGRGVLTRGLVILKTEWITANSPGTNPTTIPSYTLVNNGQTSTIQSTAMSALNTLANRVILNPKCCSAYIGNDEQDYLLWAIDSPWVLPKSALLLMYAQYIRNAYVSAPMVWSKNAQMMA